MNHSIDSKLNFDPTAHHIKDMNEISDVKILFKNFSRIVESDYSKQVESMPLFFFLLIYTVLDELVDAALHLLIGCIIGIGCLMLLTTTILCLYGYYKCRRRQFRLFTERQTLKFKYDINSYTWLGQQPSSISSSSPYLIQSTSI